VHLHQQQQQQGLQVPLGPRSSPPGTGQHLLLLLQQWAGRLPCCLQGCSLQEPLAETRLLLLLQPAGSSRHLLQLLLQLAPQQAGATRQGHRRHYGPVLSHLKQQQEGVMLLQQQQQQQQGLLSSSLSSSSSSSQSRPSTFLATHIPARCGRWGSANTAMPATLCTTGRRGHTPLLLQQHQQQQHLPEWLLPLEAAAAAWAAWDPLLLLLLHTR